MKRFLLCFTLMLSESAFAETKTVQELEALTRIVVTADPLAPSLIDYNSPVTVVEKDELVTTSETTLGETLSTKPGLSSSYFGPGSSRPVVRGYAGDRVRVLQNGLGSLDVSNTSEDHAVSVNPLSIESAEVLRGPETLLFGSSAFGGAVNLTTNSIPEIEIEEPIRGAVDFRGRTNDEELSGAFELEGGISGFNWHVDGFHQDTSDVEIPGYSESSALLELEGEEPDLDSKGKLENSATRTKGGSAGASYTWDQGFVGVSVDGIDSIYGVPGHAHEHEEEHDEEESEELVRIDLKQLRTTLRGRVDLEHRNWKSVRFKGGVSEYEHTELEGAETGTVFEQDAFETRVDTTYDFFDGFITGAIGVQLSGSDFSAVGEEAFLPEVDTFSPAVFFVEQFNFNDHFTAELGGRYEHVAYDASGFASDSFDPFSLSGGVFYDPTGYSDYTIGTTVSFSQRAPSISELYAFGPHVARSIFEVGDENIDLEQAYGVDLIFRKNTGIITGELNLFMQDFDTFINLDGTGEEEDDFPVFEYSETQALFWGFEALAQLHLHEMLGMSANSVDLITQVDLVRAEDTSADEDLPRIPPLRTRVELQYEYRKLLGASVEGVFVESQDRTAAFELPTDSYQLLNAEVTLRPLDDNLLFYVRGTNLTDEEARVHSSFIKDLAPLRGRAVLFGVRAEL